MFHVAYWAPGNTQKYANFDLERRGKVSSVQADITLDQAGSGIFGSPSKVSSHIQLILSKNFVFGKSSNFEYLILSVHQSYLSIQLSFYFLKYFIFHLNMLRHPTQPYIQIQLMLLLDDRYDQIRHQLQKHLGCLLMWPVHSSHFLF